MSIHYNGQNIKEMYYNGHKISEAYYNGEKVFSGENVLYEQSGTWDGGIFFQAPYYPAGTIIEWTPTTGIRYYGNDIFSPNSIPEGVNRIVAASEIRFLVGQNGEAYHVKIIAGAE